MESEYKKVGQHFKGCEEMTDTSSDLKRKIIAASVAGIMLTCQTGCNTYVSTSDVDEVEHAIVTSEPSTEQTNTAVKESSSISKPQSDAETIEEVNRLMIAEEISTPFKSHADRIVDSAQVQLSEADFKQTIASVGTYDKTTGASDQAEYINELLNHTTMQYGEQMTTKVMRACGYSCLDDSSIATTKRYYEEAKDMDEFLDKLNKNGIGGGKLHFEGKHIIATYDQCYCALASQKDKLPGCYCQCSCGWFEKLFVEVIKKPVKVNIKESIISGEQHCTFDILIEDL